MSADIEDLKGFVRNFVRANLEAVPPQRDISGKVHLEVWRSPGKRRAIGLEMDHDGHVNFWLVRQNVPPSLPSTVVETRKEPKDRGWTDTLGKGANSNLSGYDAFRTRPISRLGVATLDDARLVLESLLP